jgi:SAM-dependent methyltransferase
MKLSGVPVYYNLCDNCHLLFSPTIYSWSQDQFAQHIYNAEYVKIDPDYIKNRPEQWRGEMLKLFSFFNPVDRHLDYGGGSGLLSNLLRQNGWNSTTFDPFVNINTSIFDLGQFKLISSIEVFEHVNDLNFLMSNLHKLLSDDGLIIFSTKLNDGHITFGKRLNWWYASPRNGHITLFSKKSLEILARKFGFEYFSRDEDVHFLYKTKSSWFSSLIGNS